MVVESRLLQYMVLDLTLSGWLKDKASRNGHNQRLQEKSMTKLIHVFRKAEEVLRRIMVPGFDVDIVSSGIVRKLRLSKDTLIVFVDYTDSNPSCNFCRFINDQLWRTILYKAKNALYEAGFEKVVFIDYRTGLEIEL